MDFPLKQWRNENESDQQHSSVKIPKLLLQTQPLEPTASSSSSVLPLFVSDPSISSSVSSRLSDMGAGGFFSLAQWQELELQALIFRYILAGAAVPPELLQPIKKSLHHSSPSYFLHHPLQHFPHYQSALLPAGYWGRGSMDPEPGRCRRTDGKKWRCSRDVVAGHKYCERHMHRGRNRSRKPVEIPTSNPTNTGGVGSVGTAGNSSNSADTAAQHLVSGSNGTHFTLSGSSPSVDLFHFNTSSSGSKNKNWGQYESINEVNDNGKSDGHILRHFFDDWPRSVQEHDNGGQSTNQINSATLLSISIPENSPSSDVSLKLATGIVEEPGSEDRNGEREQPQLSWSTGWAANQMAPMGGPLAEVLRSSNANSPTSVLHDQLPRGTVSEASVVGT